MHSADLPAGTRDIQIGFRSGVINSDRWIPTDWPVGSINSPLAVPRVILRDAGEVSPPPSIPASLSSTSTSTNTAETGRGVFFSLDDPRASLVQYRPVVSSPRLVCRTCASVCNFLPGLLASYITGGGGAPLLITVLHRRRIALPGEFSPSFTVYN